MQQHEKLLSQRTPPKYMVSLQSLNPLPHFLKASLENLKKYENVRTQGLEQRIIVCDLLKTKANNLLKEHLIQEACQTYEQVKRFKTMCNLFSGFIYLLLHHPKTFQREKNWYISPSY
jgi:hypothetical protein